MEISGCPSFAPALIAIATAFFVFVLVARALAFTSLAVFAAGCDVSARGALFEALIETQRRANEIESGTQTILQEALIAEMQRFRLVGEEHECRR